MKNISYKWEKPKDELKRILEKEKKIYLGNSGLKLMLNNAENYCIYKFLYALRHCEYHLHYTSVYHKLMYSYYLRLKNKWGIRLGIYAWPFSLGEGVLISHAGSILINGNAKVGKNCIFHGENCVGNKGTGSEAPIVGNNVDFGVGSKVIGNITIANNVKIGANAVVIRSCYKEGALLVGVPAREMGN